MTTPIDAPTARANSLIGRLIGGKFRIESLLGAGGMGNVYRAEQLSLAKPVAVKILHHDLMADETVVKRFEREARSASRLDHPNLVRIIDFGRDTDTGVLFIAMELLSGRDLGQVIAQDGPMPLHRIVRIMSQVLAALEEAHAQGVVHRDLKPANIMLVDRRGELDLVKVCDFGIAKSNSLQTQSNSMLTVRGFVCGTPEYMAPEQARGETVDGRTDLYAAAVILYQLITGQVPFTASSPVGVLSQHLDRPAPTPRSKRPDIPRALDLLILRGLEKEPINRPQTAAAFRQELEAVCSISAHGRTEATTHTIHATPQKRGGHLKRGGFLVGVLLGAGVAVFSYLQRAPEPPVAAAPPPVKSVVLTEPRADELPPRAAEPAPTVAAVEEPRMERPAVAAAPSVKHHRVKAVAVRASVTEGMQTVASAGSPTTTTTTATTTTSSAGEPSPSPGPRGAREILGEAEKLLSQGEVASACARGEEARAVAPKMPAISRFLGKCYMRAGNVPKASERYKTYLELAPDAPDAAFIKSIVK
jgi:serine/threonine protein kinase